MRWIVGLAPPAEPRVLRHRLRQASNRGGAGWGGVGWFILTILEVAGFGQPLEFQLNQQLFSSCLVAVL